MTAFSTFDLMLSRHWIQKAGEATLPALVDALKTEHRVCFTGQATKLLSRRAYGTSYPAGDFVVLSFPAHVNILFALRDLNFHAQALDYRRPSILESLAVIRKVAAAGELPEKLLICHEPVYMYVGDRQVSRRCCLLVVKNGDWYLVKAVRSHATNLFDGKHAFLVLRAG